MVLIGHSPGMLAEFWAGNRYRGQGMDVAAWGMPKRTWPASMLELSTFCFPRCYHASRYSDRAMGEEMGLKGQGIVHCWECSRGTLQAQVWREDVLPGCPLYQYASGDEAELMLLLPAGLWQFRQRCELRR